MAAKKQLSLAVLCALAVFFTGCSGFTVPDFDEAVQQEQIIPADWKPVKLRVGLAPFSSDLELDSKKLNVEDTERWVLTPDEARLNTGENSLHSQFLQTLSRYKMFERVESIRGANSKHNIEELRAMALAQGLDVVLRPVVRRSDVGYVGTNAAYGWNLAMWLVVSPINSWWVADEDFDAHLECDFGLYSASSGKPLRIKRVKSEKPVVKAFDDWDHGFHLFAIFSVPGYFDYENWEKVGSKIMPFADFEAKKQALRYVTRELSKEVDSNSFQDGIRRKIGLFVGVDGNGQNGVPLTRYAAQDALELARALVAAGSDPLVRGATSSITGSQATSAGVQSAIGGIAKLARGNDDLFLGFSGVGTLTPDGKPALLMASAKGGYEVMSLESFVDGALVGKPRSLVLMLDCSFLSTADSRCAVNAELLAKLEGAPQESLLKPLLERCRLAGTQCIILSATGALVGEAAQDHALELEDLGHGLFTSFMLDGLAGAANTDGAPGVTLEELMAYLTPNVQRIAGFDDKVQVPFGLWSDGRKGYLLPSSEKKVGER